MPRVSVVIPTHNRASFLHTAISSVLNQSFQDFEIIVVDDASTDTTRDIVTGFRDSRIKAIHHEACRGGSAARNTGIRNSNCDYVAFLDDDDEWFPEKLNQQMNLFQRSAHTVGLIYSGYVFVERSNGKTLGQKVAERRGNLAKEMLVENHVGGTSSVVIRRECFNRVGLFDESLPSFQDYDLWIRLAKVFQFDYVKGPLFKYYVHSSKIWGNLDAIGQGMEAMLAKYGDSRPLRRYLSKGYLSLGVRYCNQKDIQAGKKALSKAIHLNPLGVSSYWNLALAGLGAGSFTRYTGLKTMLRESLRGGQH